VGNVVLSATIGFDEAGRPAELFLSGAKDGSGFAAILEDASVVISIALQCGIPAAALAKSIARIPESLEGPAVKPASPIGAALDLLVKYEAAQDG
jgi:ribonucleoside-diphosphate reductase alpha chain